MGFTSIGNFRKMFSSRCKHSKYVPEVTTRETLDQQAIEQEMAEEAEKQRKEAAGNDDDELDINDLKKPYTMDDITAGMDKMKV